MVFPQIESKKKRDELASRMRLWRRMRDVHNRKAKDQEPFTLGKQLEISSANFCGANAAGFGEALHMLYAD